MKRVFNLTVEQQIEMRQLLDSNELQLHTETYGPFTSYVEAYLHLKGERKITDFNKGGRKDQ